MSLLPKKKEIITIKVRYVTEDDVIRVLDEEEKVPEGQEAIEEEFHFRAPRWGDTRYVMSAASSLGEDGINIDPYKFIDARIKRLIDDWSLKNEKGKKVALHEQNIDNLPPDVVSYINSQLDQNPAVSKAFGNQS
jgi:hypothetical protein